MTKPASQFTAGQRKFLKAVAAGERASFHVRVTSAILNDGYVVPRTGAIFPWLVGCNCQNAADYFLTEKGAALFARA